MNVDDLEQQRAHRDRRRARLDGGILEARDVDEVRDQPRHLAQGAHRRAQRLLLLVAERDGGREVGDVAERDGQAVVEIVGEQRRGLGAVRDQAIGALAGEPVLDERLLGARGGDRAAAELGDHDRLDDHVIRAGLEARAAGLLVVLTAEHGDPHGRIDISLPIADELAAKQIRQLEINAQEFGFQLDR